MELANGANALKCAPLSGSSIMLQRANVETIVTCKMPLMGTALFVPERQRVKAESARTPGVTGVGAVKQHVFTTVIWCGLISEKPHQTARAFMNCPSHFLRRLHFPPSYAAGGGRRISKLINCWFATALQHYTTLTSNPSQGGTRTSGRLSSRVAVATTAWVDGRFCQQHCNAQDRRGQRAGNWHRNGFGSRLSEQWQQSH